MARDFTTGNPMKVIFAFSMPMLIGNVFQQLYSTVDSIIVGNFEGKNALAAISGSSSVQFLIVSIAFGFTAGMSVVISQVYGARDFSRIKRVFSTGFIFTMILGVILGIIGWFICPPLLRLLDMPESLMADGVRYLRIMFLGMPPMFFYNTYASVLRAVGDSKTPLYFLVVACITNIILDYVFVAYFGMGVAGVAWATLIAQRLSGILCHIYVGKKVEIFHLHKGEWIFDRDIIGTIVKYGLPSSIQQSIMSVSMMFVQTFVNFYGENMIAAFGISNRIENFVTMPMMNIAMAMSMYAGQNIGAGQEKRAIEGVKATVIMQLIFAFAMAFIMPVVAPLLIGMFGLADDPAVLELAIMGISFTARLLFIFGLFQALNQFHRGVGDTTFSMIASLAMAFVRVPVTYALVHIFAIGEISIWRSMIISWSFALLLQSIRFFTGGWKGKAFVSGRVREAAD